jgi:catechol 2,3-dioxygenase-like lactoylglutathione lyase family enzyme
MIEASGVDHVVLHVSDVERSKKFYTEILRTTETLKAELEQRRIALSGRPGQDRCIYFRDPDGHRLQLIVRS